MSWTVELTRNAQKQVGKLPARIRDILGMLLVDIENTGAVQGRWKNYSKLSPRRHHCHLKSGKPTYVAVWEESPAGIKLIEVTYVGTHERAPY